MQFPAVSRQITGSGNFRWEKSSEKRKQFVGRVFVLDRAITESYYLVVVFFLKVNPGSIDSY